jgi:hypothetical protein
MAQEQQGGRPEDLSQDPLIDALVPDPAAGPPNAVVLQGFLGRGTKDGSWRLYLSSSLDEYVELQQEDILYARKLPEDQGTMVWVPKSVRLEYVRVQSAQVEAEFLAGPISEANLPGAATGGIGATPIGGQFPTAPSFCLICPVSVWRPCNFTIPFWICRSVPIWQCRSLFQPWICSIPIWRCRSIYQPICSLPVWRCRSLIQPWWCSIQIWRCGFPTTPQICQLATFGPRCPSLGACPSFVDACPSQAIGCRDPGDPFENPEWGGQVGLGGMAGMGGMGGMTGMGGMGAMGGMAGMGGMDPMGGMASMDPGTGPPGFAG